MTFSAAPWAIDGARTKAGLARRAEFAALGRSEGIVENTDLKVTSLTVDGNGLLISGGNAVILNRYQTDPNESYVVANSDTHEILPLDMPSSQATPKSYLVLITIGDQEFSQLGHPWMPSDDLEPAEAEDYIYVRPYLLEVPAATTSFAGLGLAYPALALARVDIPASTTTITDAMITDLRKLVRPNTHEEFVYIDADAGQNYIDQITPAWEDWWDENKLTCVIPEWATRAVVQGVTTGLAFDADFSANLRVTLVGGGSTVATAFSRGAPTTPPDRTEVNFGGIIDVTAFAGQTKTFRIQANLTSSASANDVWKDGATATMLRVRFEEAPI